MGIFDSVKMRRVKRSKFNLSFRKRGSFNMGYLYPTMVQDCLPGDSYRVRPNNFVRFAPMLAPPMANVNCYIHHFFVPYRLVWDEFEEFITGGPQGDAAPIHPTFTIDSTRLNTADFMTTGSLSDWLGFPSYPQAGTAVTDSQLVSSLYHRAYQLIYQEYFRDQNFTSANVQIPKTSGSDNANIADLKPLQKRAWRKDYFTSALPWAQRGPEVNVPVEGQGVPNYMPISEVYDSSGDPASASGDLNVDIGDETLYIQGSQPGRIVNISSVSMSAVNFTINMLRYSLRLQEWMENNARGGGRYNEQMLAHFDVVSSDARLQRPEFVGGSVYPVRFSEVLSTAPDATDPLATMAGHGMSFGGDAGFTYKCEEHGILMGIMSVIPAAEYFQGIPRKFTRLDKLDWAFPEFANLGEQDVRNRELYYNPYGVSGTAAGTFGYQSRFADYKFEPSTIHGDFRTNLLYWNMARKFDAQPVLGPEFVEADPTTRIFAVEGEDVQHLYCTLDYQVDAIRPLPYYSVPNI